ncbi:acetyl-CoA carboxylase biotin carboxyl carrier protein [Pediococcus argentinicus]|uniref:Lipoyl-binding domain-containing protein n=1 Tax=Pediococcus argentinicus TaxID=480391 RepID=A0A0R2NJ35_9LACO|nr:biotin/lipoyl-containing protein [Pediococcus argentinicus]KRO25807.1 hypothetical protein IV88_GL001570 [Pediococcus argentinicus]NKZ21974.1 acetyl-CoA carboxylase biotin carboxyl carrier protein subunit [Pediococcus argentinicus]GEP19143.1 acetyl-CoA carboxylase biotin carboxyl carrier protein subunit [Pediococcus argentinicus]
MKIDEVFKIMQRLEDYPYNEIDIEIEGLKLHVNKNGQKETDNVELDDDDVITSPMVGIIHINDNIQEGTTVTKGQVLGQIESMKLFNDLKAPQDGEIKKIHVEDGTGIQFGEPIFTITGAK